MKPKFPIHEAQALLNKLIGEHGVFAYLEVSDKMTRVLGMATPATGLIKLSAHLPEEELEETIRHEYAHIISTHKHNWQWKAACRKVGANPVKYASITLAPDMKRKVRSFMCPGCNRIFKRKNRAANKLMCRFCYTGCEHWKEVGGEG